MIFRDRADAGRRLAQALLPERASAPVVLGLPRGGVPVAAEVARALDAPLDVIVVRKLGLPSQPELAMGAVGEDGVRVLDETTLRYAEVRDETLALVEQRAAAEVAERVARIRAYRPRVPLEGRRALLVDDGVATGSTATAACAVARGLGAASVVLAVPVAPAEVLPALGNAADELVVLETPPGFSAVGQWYEDFRSTSEDEVEQLLRAAEERCSQPASRGGGE